MVFREFLKIQYCWNIHVRFDVYTRPELTFANVSTMWFTGVGRGVCVEQAYTTTIEYHNPV